MGKSIKLDVSKYYFIDNNNQSEVIGIDGALHFKDSFTFSDGHNRDFIDVYGNVHYNFYVFCCCESEN